MIKHHFIGIVLVLSAMAAITRGDDPRLQRFTFSEPHMGTLFKIVLYAPDEATAKKAAKAAFARIAELDRIMSDYQPTSELMQLCKKAGGGAVSVSDDLFSVLTTAQKISKESKGAFDVTIGPVVRLWRRARRTRQLPDRDELARALKLVGYENIRLDPSKKTVQLLIEGMLLDLGGIAKGYAADAALEVLRQHGIRRALVAAGGDIRTGDPPPDAKGWKVGVAQLKNPEGVPAHYLLLTQAAVSTSGDAEQFVEIGGKRYSHIVDPQTGLGLVGRRSTTVIAANGTLSDGLATAACVMGPEKGVALVERFDKAAALYIFESDRGLTTKKSKGFDRFLFPEKE
jgi:thiamine biosynthesis lipoprotein